MITEQAAQNHVKSSVKPERKQNPWNVSFIQLHIILFTHLKIARSTSKSVFATSPERRCTRMNRSPQPRSLLLLPLCWTRTLAYQWGSPL